MLKKIILGALVALMLTACGRSELYMLHVTATKNTITGRDTHGAAVTLTECRTEDGERILLEDVEPGHRYRVILDSCGTWNKEDDAIVSVRKE